MKLIVGLGNPGEKYARNRHNVGFLALDRIAERHRFPAWRRRFQGVTTEATIAGERVVLLKPDTFMNESGRAVGEASRFLKIPEADIVVLHDELDLAPGKVKIKSGGGNAGHNGLRSISAHVGNEYVRVRIGIGHPGSRDAVVHFVLHDFARSDAVWLDPLLDAIADAAPRLAAGDQSRFLTEVARATEPEKPKARENPKARTARSDGNEAARLSPPPRQRLKRPATTPPAKKPRPTRRPRAHTQPASAPPSANRPSPTTSGNGSPPATRTSNDTRWSAAPAALVGVRLRSRSLRCCPRRPWRASQATKPREDTLAQRARMLAAMAV